MFVLLQGKRYGPAAHQRYFQLKGWSAGQREKWIEDHTAAYTRLVHDAAPQARILDRCGLWIAMYLQGWLYANMIYSNQLRRASCPA